ncbi:M73 family metallopeptidase [Patescibacteria group bacterium]|nr:M73 family metallopeptidase [Patescibacteria group bacterium]MBU4512202.1 M73 family metallopeptidase [Patescibacteria group bacterium]MCG2693449.1 CalY family protein [Candidatus Parcubacteria bacterium]
MKKILISLSIIGAVAAIVIGATTAFFSDIETSSGNTFTAGVVDIVVDDQNPWDEHSEPFVLDDIKPSQTRYIEFTIRNLVESNPADVWKHINVTSQVDGVITEPECTEGGGTWIWEPVTQTGTCEGDYEERNNLAAYIIYDLYVCEDPATDKCLTDGDSKPTDIGDWIPIITEEQYVRLDNVSSAWIKLGQLNSAKELKVVQSYHLRSWPDAPEEEVGNWAQGDILTFDIEIYAEQLGGYGPKGEQAMLTLDNKDENWDPVSDDISATLTYKTSGEEFDYSLTGTVQNTDTNYCLIYYADPYPGNGPGGTGGALIGSELSDGAGNITMSGTPDLGMDLPSADDDNYPAGAKIWLVPCGEYDQAGNMLTAWNPAEYLFEMQFITYDDTGI